MIPYMGSKRISAGKIFQAISNLHPNGGMLVDLFCGGFAISEYFYKNGWRVIANDKNKYVIALLKTIIFDSIEENKLTKLLLGKCLKILKIILIIMKIGMWGLFSVVGVLGILKEVIYLVRMLKALKKQGMS